MGIEFDVLAQGALVVLQAAVGLGLAVVIYWIWVRIRRRVWRLDTAPLVESPDGRQFRVEVPNMRVRVPITRRVFRLKSDQRNPPALSSQSDRLHPDRIMGFADEYMLFVLPFVLVGVVLVGLLLVLELIVASALFIVTWIVFTVMRYEWSCIISENGDEVGRVRARGLRRIRRCRDDVVDAIRRGELDSVTTSPRRGSH